MQTRLLVIVGDPHCGSTVGLMPPRFERIDGITLEQNAVQAWLWRCWIDCVAWILDKTGDDPWTFVINGDLIDGDHHGTKEIISKDLLDHTNCAEESLSALAHLAETLFVIRGTECHTNNHEITVARHLGAVRNDEIKQPIFDRLNLRMGGRHILIKHHTQTTSAPWLESGVVSREFVKEGYEALRNHEEAPSIICAAHRHIAQHCEIEDNLFVVTPPWQALTRWGHNKVSHSRTHPGCYILDWRERDDGDMPQIHKRSYVQPAPKIFEF